MSNSILKTKTLKESLSSSKSKRSIEAPSRKRSRGRKVEFHHVEIREYPMILNESQTGSAQLTIEWESISQKSTPVSQHEVFGKTGGTKHFSTQERVTILLRSGYTPTFLRRHLTKPSPYTLEKERPKKQRKNIFSKMHLFKKKVAMAYAAA